METLRWLVFVFVVFKRNEAELQKPVIKVVLPIVEYKRPNFTCNSKFVVVPVNISSKSITYTWFSNEVKVTNDIRANVYSPNLNRKQTGTKITCFATDVLSNKSPTSNAFIIHVEYKPGKPIFKPARSVYTLGNNCSTTLGPIVCSSDCAPPCSYQWRAGRTLVNHAVFPLMLFTRPDGRNLTNLYCISKNRHGTFTRDITVRFVPDAPGGFRCIARSQDSVLLTGRSTDTTLRFQISKGDFSNVLNPFSMVSGFRLNLTYEGNTFTVNVSGLDNGTTFRFRVFVWSLYGNSDPAEIFCQTTIGPIQTTKGARSLGPGFAVGVGVGVAVVLVLVVILVLVAVVYFKITATGKRKAKNFKALFSQQTDKSDVHKEAGGMGSSERKGPEGIETQESVTSGAQYEALGATEPQTPSTYDKLELYENQNFHKLDTIYVNDIAVKEMLDH